MIKYEIIRVDTEMLSMQVKYSKEGMPDFYVRMSFDKPYSELSLHETAKRQVLQADLFWQRHLENPPVTLNNPVGFAKPTRVEPARDYDDGQQKLEERVIETAEEYVVRFTPVDLTEAEKAEAIRNKRVALLQQTDSFALADRPMTDEIRAYRQALRDIPDQEGFPNDIIWPTMPIE